MKIRVCPAETFHHAPLTWDFTELRPEPKFGIAIKVSARANDHGGVPAGERHDPEKPGLPVDECHDLATVRADDQIAFQVPGLTE
nr:hypothetical protein [Streptomyces sp. 3211]